ncbi:hypothetical protein T05_2531 [Trichinella murrelli]|uniref:Uncharacterized protein n=1 Tax=Trichinella murrelli TaxID=144512 RepID=A0A0V0THS0_9BILA|nr:hypothetical protein T05_2531 [Trichinella murrelli]
MYQGIDGFPRLGSTSSACIPCCLPFEHSETGTDELTVDSPDQRQPIPGFSHREIGHTNRLQLTRGQGASRLAPLESASVGDASNCHTGLGPTGYRHRSVGVLKLQWAPHRDRDHLPSPGLVGNGLFCPMLGCNEYCQFPSRLHSRPFPPGLRPSPYLP